MEEYDFLHRFTPTSARVAQDHSLPKTTDADLWQSFSNGCEEAFIQIYQDHFTSLYRYGSQFTPDRDLIKDTIQDLFLDIRKNRKNLQVTRIKPYLFVAFKRRLIHSLKKNNRIISDTDIPEGYHFEIEVSVERKVINDQQEMLDSDKLNKALATLTVRQREAIYYYYFENLSYPEIAQLMSFTDIKSARNIVYKALQGLKAVYL